MENVMFLYHVCREQDKGDTSKGYVGVTNNTKERWGEHKRLKTNAHLTNALTKYTDVIFYVICKATKEFVLYLERKLRPVDNLGWNITKGGGMPPLWKGKTHSIATKDKMSIRQSGTNNPNYGKTRTSESIEKMLNTIEQNGGHPLKGKFGVDNPSYGRKCTKEQKALMSVKGKERVYKQVPCNHCGKLGSSQAMGRWHFDNCRSK